MKEKWKDIKGYEGFYQVSDLGRVHSLGRVIAVSRSTRIKTLTIRDRILKHRPNGDGYPTVALYNKENQRKDISVHLLVITTFVGPRPHPYMQCRHLNGDIVDCRSTNLKWGTSVENAQDRKDHGRGPQVTCRKGEDISWSKFTENDIRRIRKLYGENKRTQGQLAKEYAVYQSYISRIVRRMVWKHV